ncbi:MAG: MFS transporter [Planctomycetota bacterium]
MSTTDLEPEPYFVDPTVAGPSAPRSPDSSHGYDVVFWLAYLSNGLTTVANAMMVCYSDFVTVLGGEERQLGFIVGVGMIGSIITRMVQGELIDRYGAGRIWFWSTLLYCISLALHLTLTTAYGPAIFLVRVFMQSSLAGIFGASITFVSIRVVPNRMAEIIGALGTSGFLGIMLGPALGDWLRSRGTAVAVDVAAVGTTVATVGKTVASGGTSTGGTTGADFVVRLFTTSCALAIGAMMATWLAARQTARPVHRRRPPLWRVIRRYQPLMLSCTAIAMGAGFSIPMTFLRPYAVATNLDGVATFFMVYAGTAFFARLASRSLFERYGNRPWIIAGLVLLTLSFSTYPLISQKWHLIAPATLAGVAHALLFPSVIAAGTSAFPRRYLGVATSVMLAMFDVGTFIGAPVVGTFIRSAKAQHAAAYPQMFGATAVVLAAITLVYCVTSRPREPGAAGQRAARR